MTYDFTKFKQEIKKIDEWLVKEFSNIRTGQATPSILDSITVESYGSRMPINQVATIANEGARTLRIVPWDMSLLKEIEKGIIISNLGLSAVVDDKGIRVMFPELTSETRQNIAKIARQKLEEGKISLRKERETVWQDIQKQQKDGILNEDEKFRYKDEMEKYIQEGSKKLEDHYTKKEKELLN